MATKTFNISMPEELVKELDKQAKKDYTTRSEYIKRAVIGTIDKQETDETLKKINKIFANAEAKRAQYGITSEQKVYDIIEKL